MLENRGLSTFVRIRFQTDGLQPSVLIMTTKPRGDPNSLTLSTTLQGSAGVGPIYGH